MLPQAHPKPRRQFHTLPATRNPVSSECLQLTPRANLGMGHQASSSCPMEVQGQDHRALVWVVIYANAATSL